MKRHSGPSQSAARQFVVAILILLASSFALGEPITYTGFIITDGQLGAWTFHNARVILTFQSDTQYVQTLSQGCVGTDAAFNPTGVARVTIIDHEKMVTARLDPNQLFVAFDQDFGGVGIGSLAPGAPFVAATCSNAASLQPAYPLGLHHGTMDAAGGTDPAYSANQEAFPNNLQGNVGFSGKGYTCVGVPQLECDPPTTALTTDHGVLYLSEPYQGYRNDYLVTLNGSFFFQQTGHSSLPLPWSMLAPSSTVSHGSITYHMFLVSDVSLNGELFQNASIHLSFRSRTSHVTPLPSGPNSSINTGGVARVDIKQGNRAVSATFARNQIYVYFDSSTASAGFGSYSGGRVYPAALAPTIVHSDTELLGAVSDILNGGSNYYSPATVDLAAATDLKHETMLADYVSSCGSFDFLLGVCNDLLTVPKLTSDHGDFSVYEPYNKNGFNDPTSLVRSSDNFGVFWTTFDLEDD